MRDTVVGRFARAAAAAPSAEALRCGGVRLTFADVEGRASTLAAMLRRQGVPAGGVVGLLLGRSAAAIVAVLACWKAGIAYCPLSESDPPDRLARLCAELGLAAVLAAPETVTALPVPVLVIDGAAAGLAAADPFDGPPPDEEDLAYVMFTSGSTGVPLAVEVTHANCRYLDDALASLYDRVLPPGRTRVGVNAPLTFDSSVKQLLQLTRGRTLCVLTGPERADPVTFMAAVARYGIEVLDITPSHLRLLLATDPALRGLEGVWLLVGGEAMTGQLCAALSASRIAGFANVYGPTECTVNATAATAGEAPAIGRPLPGAEVFVVDGRGRPRGEGESGELVIAGAGVSRGYANSPSATARRFVVLPSLPGSPRCFRTGDVGVWRDGLLWFLGRRDDQVKVGGRRLHLIEVERQVIEATGALEAAVVLDDGDPPALVAVVGVPDGAAPAPADLLDRLRERLAPWMVPRRCVVLERLPRNRNGKVSREALTALLAEPDRAPAGEGPVDDAVAAEFARVLGVASVPPEADFFEQGGDSLSALRLLRGLERRLGRRVDVASFFERPSVAGLVSAIRAAGG